MFILSFRPSQVDFKRSGWAWSWSHTTLRDKALRRGGQIHREFDVQDDHVGVRLGREADVAHEDTGATKE